MFGIGQGADRLNEGNVGVLETFCQIPRSFIVLGCILVERGLVGISKIEDLETLSA